MGVLLNRQDLFLNAKRIKSKGINEKPEWILIGAETKFTNKEYTEGWFWEIDERIMNIIDNIIALGVNKFKEEIHTVLDFEKIIQPMWQDMFLRATWMQDAFAKTEMHYGLELSDDYICEEIEENLEEYQSKVFYALKRFNKSGHIISS